METDLQLPPQPQAHPFLQDSTLYASNCHGQNLNQILIDYQQRAANFQPSGDNSLDGETIFTIFHALGNIHLANNSFYKAISAYEKIDKLVKIKDTASKLSVYYGTATACYHLGAFGFALEYYQKIFDLNPGYKKIDEVFYHIAMIQKEHYKNYPEAIKFYKKALENEGEIPKHEVRFNMARTYEAITTEEIKNKSIAEEIYNEILNTNPQDEKLRAVTLTQLAWLIFQKWKDGVDGPHVIGRDQECKTMIENALRIHDVLLREKTNSVYREWET